MSIGGIGGAASVFSSLTAGSGATAPQAATKKGSQSAVDEFMSWANMTPGERMRAAVLKSMGLSEDDLKSMTAEKRKAVEDQIADKIKQAALDAASKGKTGVVADVKA
jgi:hypothetical protein